MYVSLQREILSRYLDDRFGDKKRGLVLKYIHIFEKHWCRENKGMGLFRERAENETRTESLVLKNANI